jgi:hypothetical protein
MSRLKPLSSEDRQRQGPLGEMYFLDQNFFQHFHKATVGLALGYSMSPYLTCEA